jgi:hypothetical protein
MRLPVRKGVSYILGGQMNLTPSPDTLPGSRVARASVSVNRAGASATLGLCPWLPVLLWLRHAKTAPCALPAGSMASHGSDEGKRGEPQAMDMCRRDVSLGKSEPGQISRRLAVPWRCEDGVIRGFVMKKLFCILLIASRGHGPDPRYCRACPDRKVPVLKLHARQARGRRSRCGLAPPSNRRRRGIPGARGRPCEGSWGCAVTSKDRW